MRARSLNKLRAQNYNGTDEEWSSILATTLAQKPSSDLSKAVRDSLEVRCSITGKGSKSVLVISLRTSVQDITQQLGSIELANTKDESGVDLWAWANQLADQRDELRKQAAEQDEQASSEARNVDVLQKQLDDLVQAKTEHERELMTKFAMLLNEKKFELRRLQQVLSTAKVDPKQLKKLEAEASGSRRGKKRAARKAADSDDSDEGAFETTNAEDVAADDSERGQTTEEETEDDDVDRDQPITSQTEPDRGTPRPSGKGKEKAPATVPGRRELPFTKQKQQPSREKNKKAPTPTADAGDESTESEDDEL